MKFGQPFGNWQTDTENIHLISHSSGLAKTQPERHQNKERRDGRGVTNELETPKRLWPEEMSWHVPYAHTVKGRGSAHTDVGTWAPIREFHLRWNTSIVIRTEWSKVGTPNLIHRGCVEQESVRLRLDFWGLRRRSFSLDFDRTLHWLGSSSFPRTCNFYDGSFMI